jgi:hypothetical protein
MVDALCGDRASALPPGFRPVRRLKGGGRPKGLPHGERWFYRAT